MTKRELQRRIEALFVKMKDLMENGSIKGSHDACDKAALDLESFETDFSNYKSIQAWEDPNTDEEKYFQVKFVDRYKQIEADFLVAYNEALVASGRQPISSLAA